jgi:hypothetical protein
MRVGSRLPASDLFGFCAFVVDSFWLGSLRTRETSPFPFVQLHASTVQSVGLVAVAVLARSRLSQADDRIAQNVGGGERQPGVAIR